MTSGGRALGVALAASIVACSPRGAAAPDASRPVPTAGPSRPLDRHPAPEVVRYGPSAVRYVVRRQLHIEQSLGGTPQTQDLGTQMFVSATITGPADTAGYPATFTIDSIVPDSGTPPPIADSFLRVRRLVFTGRVAAQGEFQGSVVSDSALARNLLQLLGNFHDFLPRIPRDGVRLGASWTDSLSSTQRGGSTEVTRRSLTQSNAAAWEVRSGTRSLRLDLSGTYTVSGSGQNGGQFFQMGGSGTSAGRAFLAEDGRFLGGESRDSAALTVSLPAQGLTLPVMQVLTTTVTPLL